MNKFIKNLNKYSHSNKKIVALTAYDYTTAKILEESGTDIILVGDSLAMVALGHPNTLSITVEEMLHHTKAVVRGTIRTPVVADMPFMSYQVNVDDAVKNAGRFIKEAGAQAIKLEGAGSKILQSTKAIIETGIPVMGHLGFTPQFINNFGGYYIQAKTADKIEELLQQAIKLQDTGIFALVLEMIPSIAAKYITENLNIPTIGIGAGPYCDGQILVTDDLLGKYSDFTPSFVRKYQNLADLSRKAIRNFVDDVRNGTFPDEESESFKPNENEIEKIDSIVNK